VWQYMQGMVGALVITLLQISKRICQLILLSVKV